MTTGTKQGSRLIVWSVFAVILAGAAVAWFVLDPGFRTGAQQSANLSELKSPDEFDRRVRDYILRNPEVIVEAVRTLQSRKNATSVNDIKTVIAARRDEIFNDPDSPVGGNPNGDVTVVEFFDYNCPYCRRVAPVTLQAERADPKLRFVYKEWPILGSNSVFAAKAALASVKQGKYLEFHKALMATKARVTEDKVMEIARAIGLDANRLRSDIENPAISAILKRNLDLARVLRMTGTPGFVIGDGIIPGAMNLATLQSRIARARKQK